VGEHTSEQFGKRTPTNTTVGIGDPEQGQFMAPTFILQQGLDERRDSTPSSIDRASPGPALWKVIVALIAMFLIGAALLWAFMRYGWHAEVPDQLAGWIAPL
jgi:hypothetical protein